MPDLIQQLTAAGLSDEQARAYETCACGDYRADHPNDGPCRYNALGDGGGLCHGFTRCMSFRGTGHVSIPPREAGKAP